MIMLGWTIFDKLYVHNGVVYIVSDDPEKTPDVQFMYSKGIHVENGPEEEASRLPTDEDIRVVSSKEARRLFGTGAQLLDGVNVCVFHFLTLHTVINRKKKTRWEIVLGE